MMEWTLEMRRRGAECATPEELLALAEAEGVPMADGEARAAFARLHPPAGELTDDELESVSGGGCGSDKRLGRRCIIPFTTTRGFDLVMRNYQAVEMEGGRYYRCNVCAKAGIVTTTFITEAASSPEAQAIGLLNVRCEHGHLPEYCTFDQYELQYLS